MVNINEDPQVLEIINAHTRNDVYVITALEKLTAPQRVKLREAVTVSCTRALNPPNASELRHLSRVLFHFNKYSTADDDRGYALFYGGIAALLDNQTTDGTHRLGNMTRYIDHMVFPPNKRQIPAYMWYISALAHYCDHKYTLAQQYLSKASSMFMHTQNTVMHEQLQVLRTCLDMPHVSGETMQQTMWTAVIASLHTYISDTHATAVSVPEPTSHTKPKNEPITPQDHVSHRSIPDGATGWSYDRLFGVYLRGATHVKIVDAYIRNYPQIKNLEIFIRTITKHAHKETPVKVVLETSRAPDNDTQQHQLLDELRNKVNKHVDFDWEYKDQRRIHDRHIIINHNRWKIILGRGLDIYQPNKRVKIFDQAQRPCRAFEITYIQDF